MQRWEGKTTESFAYTFLSLVQVDIVLYPVAGLEIPPGNKYTKLLWKPEGFSSELFTENFQDDCIQ